MPRDSSGNYTLPAGNPVVDGTIIESTWANNTLQDVATQLNNVLTRDGVLGPTVPMLFSNGTSVLPSIAFAQQPSSGFYRSPPATVGVSVAGTSRQTWNDTSSSIVGTLNIKSTGEVLHLETTTARGSGQGYVSFFDPTGRKGYLGYGGSADDSLTIVNEMGAGIIFSTTAIERARFTAAGEFLVGETAPSSPSAGRGYIGVSGTTDAAIVFDVAGAAKGFFQASASIVRMGAMVGIPMTLETGATERVRVNSTGEVGIGGTAGVGYKLDVIGTIRSFGGEAASPNYGFRVLNATGNGGGHITAGVGVNGGITVGADGGQLTFAAGGVAKAFLGTSGQGFSVGMAPTSNSIEAAGVIRASQPGKLANGVALMGGWPSGDSQGIQFFQNGVQEWRLYNPSASGDFRWSTGVNDVLALSNSQILTLGNGVVATAAGNLTMYGNAAGGVSYPRIHMNSNVTNGILLYFLYQGTAQGSIVQANATTIAYNTTSDARMKTDIVDMEDVGAIIDGLRARSFTWRSTGERARGLVAQEAVEFAPEIVTHIEEGDIDLWGIDYGKLTPLLLREVQSLRARVAALEH